MNDALPLVIANLKANKTWDEVSTWLENVGPGAAGFSGTVVFCPSFPYLVSSSQKIKDLNLKLELGAQDVSMFEQGAYTGEVAASQIADLCRYVIIGHSERRQNFRETEEILSKKVKNSKKAGLEPIFCIQGEETPIPEGVEIVAYEPIFAIGSGNADDPQNARKVAQTVKNNKNITVIYGGSVSAKNVNSFLKKDILDGVLVATNSLDPQDFIKILEATA